MPNLRHICTMCGSCCNMQVDVQACVQLALHATWLKKINAGKWLLCRIHWDCLMFRSIATAQNPKPLEPLNLTQPRSGPQAQPSSKVSRLDDTGTWTKPVKEEYTCSLLPHLKHLGSLIRSHAMMVGSSPYLHPSACSSFFLFTEQIDTMTSPSESSINHICSDLVL